MYKLPCTCCAIKLDDLAVANSNFAPNGVNSGRDGKLVDYPNWRCYNKPMVTPERIAQIGEQDETIKRQLGDVAEQIDSLAEQSWIAGKIQEVVV